MLARDQFIEVWEERSRERVKERRGEGEKKKKVAPPKFSQLTLLPPGAPSTWSLVSKLARSLSPTPVTPVGRKKFLFRSDSNDVIYFLIGRQK